MRLVAAALLAWHLVLVICASAAPAASQMPEVEIITPRPFSKKKTPPIKITWRTDLDAAKQEAARTSRCVLIYFHANWCQPCTWMDEGTFASPAVAQYVLAKFIPVKIDDSEETSPVSREYHIRVYPTVLFLDPAGRPLHMLVRPRPPAEFYPVLKKVDGLVRLMANRKAKPNDLEANFALGNAFATLEPLNALAPLTQLKRAEPYLKRAVELDPKNAKGRRSQARLILALVPLADGDVDPVLRNLDDWLAEFKNAPEAPVAVHFKATILYQDGRLEEARKYFARILREYPTHPKAYDADKAIEVIEARLKAREAMKNEKKAPGVGPAEPPAKPAAEKKPLG